MEWTTKFSARMASLGVLGAALALLPAAGSLRAQTNPATALNAARNGAQTANQNTGQTATQPKTQTQPKSQAQTKTQPAPQSQPKTPLQPAQPNQSQAQAKTTAKPAPVTGKATPITTKQSAAKHESGTTMAKPASGAPKTVPVVARPTEAPAPAPAPAPKAIEIPKPAEPMIHAIANRRDPFSSLIGRETHGGIGKDPVLPPGKAGLQVETLTIQGVVKGPNGMVAVVANPQQRVYFIHEGDSLFDGKVDRITIEGVTFHEVGKDAFGKPLERDVTRRINAMNSGEQP
jgi:Tfp pilus assembly protein PilP